MTEGFWILQYEAIQGNGGGVITFIKGQVFGGDSGFVYTGTYTSEDTAVAARVLVRNFLPTYNSDLGVKGDVELEVRATHLTSTEIRGSAVMVGYELPGVAVKLTKVSDLPT